MGIVAAFILGGRDVPKYGHSSFQHGEVQHIKIFFADFPHQGDIRLPVINSGELNVQRFQRRDEPPDIGGVHLEKFRIGGDPLGQPAFLIDAAEMRKREEIERVQDEKPPFALPKDGCTFTPCTEPFWVFLA